MNQGTNTPSCRLLKLRGVDIRTAAPLVVYNALQPAAAIADCIERELGLESAIPYAERVAWQNGEDAADYAVAAEILRNKATVGNR